MAERESMVGRPARPGPARRVRQVWLSLVTCSKVKAGAEEEVAADDFFAGGGDGADATRFGAGTASSPSIVLTTPSATRW